VTHHVPIKGSNNMHRSHLTLGRLAGFIALPCVLWGCAANGTRTGTGPAAKSLPGDAAVRVYGPERGFATLANEGRAVPLHKAVEQLVPADYGVRWIEVDASRRKAPVTWAAPQEWPAALREAITGVPGLTVDVATGSRLVLIRQVAPALRPVPAALPASAAAARPVPVPTAMPAVAPAPVQARHWGLGERDRTLKAAIERWSEEAGWRLFWELGVDYPIAAAASIGGNFEEAVATVVRSMEHADVPPKAIFYRGNQVLRMVPRGME
jgi:hypothetical protein